jgi:hypothetical protein
MQIAVLGIDLGKNSCSIVGLDDEGELSCCGDVCCREGVIKLAARLKPCVAAMVLRGASSWPRPAGSGP